MEAQPENAASIAERLDRLDGAVAELRKKRKDTWEKFQALSPFVTAVVVAVLGYALNRTVNDALQEQQLLVSNVKEMRELLLQVGSEEVTPEKARTTALTLAAFGRHAIPPLVNILDSGGEVRGPAAEQGLRAVGLTDRKAACDRMVSVAGDVNGLYTWTTHRFAIRLLGELGCEKAASPAMQDFRDVVGGDAQGLRGALRDGDRLDERKVGEVAQQLGDELTRTASRLERSARRSR
jgi:hypothetical protein